MLSDTENLDIMLGRNNPENEVSDFGNSVRRPERSSYNTLVNHDANSHSNFREDEIRGYAGNDRNSGKVDSSSEINRLSGELNERIAQALSDLLSSVSSQTQGATNEAINEQVLPQIQATLRSGQGQISNRRCDVPARRLGCISEEALNRKFRSSSREGLPRDLNRNEDLEDTR